MANTISSDILPRIIGEARETLSQSMELIRRLNKDFSGAAGKIGQTVGIGVPALLTAASKSTAATAAAPSNITNGSATLTLDQYYAASFGYSAVEAQTYDLPSLFTQQLREAVRAVAYKVNATTWAKYYQIPYFTGTAGTGFFASNSKQLNTVNTELFKRGVDPMNMVAVLTPTEHTALTGLDNMMYANYYGSAEAVRTGKVPLVGGFEIARDQQVPKHTIGTITTGIAAKANTTAGTATLVVTTAASTGACALVTGDIVTVGSYNYALQADATQASAASDVTLTLDRVLDAAVTASDAVTLATGHGTSMVSIAGDLSGISLVMRRPGTEVLGFSVQGDHYPILDEKSGAVFDLGVYPQDGLVKFEVSAIWGNAVTDSRKLQRLYGLTA